MGGLWRLLCPGSYGSPSGSPSGPPEAALVSPLLRVCCPGGPARRHGGRSPSVGGTLSSGTAFLKPAPGSVSPAAPALSGCHAAPGQACGHGCASLRLDQAGPGLGPGRPANAGHEAATGLAVWRVSHPRGAEVCLQVGLCVWSGRGTLSRQQWGRAAWPRAAGAGGAPVVGPGVGGGACRLSACSCGSIGLGSSSALPPVSSPLTWLPPSPSVHCLSSGPWLPAVNPEFWR